MLVKHLLVDSQNGYPTNCLNAIADVSKYLVVVFGYQQIMSGT